MRQPGLDRRRLALLLLAATFAVALAAGLWWWPTVGLDTATAPSPIATDAAPAPAVTTLGDAPAVAADHRVAMPAAAAPNGAPPWAPDAIQGLVLGPAGKPQPDAAMTLRLAAPAAAGERGRAAAISRSVTGADGRFRFAPCPEGVLHELRVDADGCTPARFVVVPGRELQLDLRAAVALHGRVLAHGEPVVGAALELTFGYPPVPVAARSDAAGSYRFAAVPAATHLSLAVRCPGSGVQRFPLLTAAEDSRYDVVLAGLRAVEGIVFDADTGANVAASLRADPDTEVARSDAAGRFVLPIAEEGCTLVWAFASGYAPTVCELALPPADAPPQLRIGLRRGATLQGVVRTEKGEPLAGAAVEVACTETPERPGQRPPGVRSGWRLPPPAPPVLPMGCSVRLPGPVHVVTAADGSFRVDGLGCGGGAFFAHVTATADGRGARTAAAVPLALPGGTGHVELQLAPAARLSGRVHHGSEGVRALVELWLGGVLHSAPSNDRGEFHFGGLPAGEGRLTAVRDGAPFVRAEVAVSIPAGGTVVQDLALQGRLGRIVGVVRDASGEPAGGLPLQAQADAGRGGPVLAGVTDARGEFTLLVPGEVGRYRLHVLAAIEPFVRDGVLADGPPLELVLPPSGIVRVELVLPEPFAAPGGIDIAWRRTPGEPWRQVASQSPAAPDGQPLVFELHLPVGALELLLEPESNVCQEIVVPITVAAGDAPVRLPVPLRAMPQLVVEFAGDRALLAGRTLQLQRHRRGDASWRGRRPDQEVDAYAVEADAAGEALVGHVRPGRYGWSCDPDDLVLTPAEFDVAVEPAQQRVRVEVRARGGGR